jgi:dTDP-4-dehydrorhamnose reductase
MKKVLITGSKGMLGRALIRSLDGHDSVQAIGTDLLSEEHKLDITDANQVSGFIKGIMPDIIIHAAAYTDVDGCEQHPERAYAVNAEGTKNIAQAAKDVNAFMIHISTDYVFDGEKTSPYIETDKTSPINIYGESKLLAERAIKDTMDNYLIIRTSWLFGKGGKNFVDSIIQKVEAGEKLTVVDDQKGSPTYTTDLAIAICKLLDSSALRPQNDNTCNSKGAINPCHSEGVCRRQTTEESKHATPKILHVTNSGSCTWYEFAKEILRIKNIENIKIKPIKSDEISLPAKRPAMSVLDNAEYAKITGKALPPWQDALHRYVLEK